MKKIFAKAGWKPAVCIAGILPALLIAALAGAEEPQKITVTGDRVSLRAAPQLDAVLLSRASLNEQLVLADNSNPEWVGVQPPERIDLWVHNDFVENDTVVPPRLNVRSGPSPSHGVVGVISGGDRLAVRGKLDGWLRIAPPEGTTVWISRQFVTVPDPPAEPERPTEPMLVTLDPEIAAIPVQTAGEDSGEITAGTEEPPALKPVAAQELPRVLKADPDKEQGQHAKCVGRLRPVNNLLYKLVAEDEQMVVCYVRGNMEQMEILSGFRLIITGKTYWVAGLRIPMVVPSRIEVLRPSPAE